MLYALRQPAVLLGLVLGFAVGMIALSGATRLLERNTRFPVPFWHPRAWLDPYSAVSAVLAGVGWAPRPEVRRGFGRSRNRQLWLVAAVSFVIPAALGAAGMAVYAAGAGRIGLRVMDSISVLHVDPGFVNAVATSFAEKVALGFGIENLAIAILSLVPIPPLPTGVALWTVLPRTPGARQLAYRLLEEHWGIVALLVLALLPIGGGYQTPLLSLVTTITDAVLHSF
ncbi:MAG TPA: hypothetical protein VG650_04885 [Mycobacteriales bacterium]|nr:hypothetical protein [Mycobacteriales bacterium]